MRIVIPATGSRGDVQPYLALGRGLQGAGHQVCLATHTDYAGFVRGRGLDFFPLASSARKLHASEAGQCMMNAGRNPFAFIRHYARLREPHLHALLARCLEACRGADLILVPTTGVLVAHAVAEKLGLPTVRAFLAPMTPSRAFAGCLFPELPSWLPGRGWYNVASHLVIGEYFWQCQRATVNRALQDVLGMPPLPFLGPTAWLLRDQPTLYGYSPLVLPKPADWSAYHQVTGYWFLDRPTQWRPPARLVDFLNAGPPPICFGFGSMYNHEAAATVEQVARALRRTGQRGVLLTGWGGLDQTGSSEQLFLATSIPHDWLFPRSAAVVHHGGAGTTAAGLRAGVPTLVVPFAADQFFWGRRVGELGVGPRLIPHGHLSVERLAAAIRVMIDDRPLRDRAAALSARLTAEDGVARAVELFQGYVQAPALQPGMPSRRRVERELLGPVSEG